MLANHLHRAPEEVVPAFAAHREDGNVPIAVFIHITLRGANQVGVETPAQTAVSGDQHQKLPLDGPHGKQRMRTVGSARHDAREQRHHLVRIRPRIEDAVLGAPQPRGGHHFHRPGNLLRALYRADPASNVE